MRKFTRKISNKVVLGWCCIAIAFCISHFDRPPVVKPVTIQTPPDGTTVKKDTTKPKKKALSTSSGVRAFMRLMSKIESNHNCKAVNPYGMMGCYQFSPKTVKAMGFHVTQEEFLNDKNLQDRVMLKFMRDNRRSLKGVIEKFSGQVVNGVRVSEAGILGSSHLAGVGGVLSFFYPEKYSYRGVDANGATVAMYMEKFEHFDVSGL